MNPLLDLSAHPVIGHRGAPGLAPENTSYALELALEEGADALEFDVHLSADGVPVLMHDPLLERTTAASGPLRARTAAELAGLDAGYRFTRDGGATFPWRGRGLGIPSLAEVLERFPAVPLLIELKTVEVAKPVRRLLLQEGAVDRVIVASFHSLALLPFREAGLPTAGSRREIGGLWLRSKLGMRATGIAPLAYAVPDRYRERVPVATTSFIRAARRAGRPVHVWTVNEPERAEQLWERGASGIITNFPGLMLPVRNRLFPAEGKR